MKSLQITLFDDVDEDNINRIFDVDNMNFEHKVFAHGRAHSGQFL